MPEVKPSNNDFLYKFLGILRFIVILLLAGSFLLMVLNVLFFFGFQSTLIYSTHATTNPFGLSIPLIWAIHLPVGFLAGMIFSKKRYFLTGSMGLLCATLITGISFLYFGWRESISTVEVLIPLILGIVPVVKLHDFIKRTYLTK